MKKELVSDLRPVLELLREVPNIRNSNNIKGGKVINEHGKTIAVFQDQHGRFHRDGDLPARLDFDACGKLWREQYYKGGLLHRDNNLPAVLHYGTLSEEFWNNGQQTREIRYRKDKDGDLQVEMDRKFYEDGSTRTWWYDESGGVKTFEELDKYGYVKNNDRIR